MTLIPTARNLKQIDFWLYGLNGHFTHKRWKNCRANHGLTYLYISLKGIFCCLSVGLYWTITCGSCHVLLCLSLAISCNLPN